MFEEATELRARVGDENVFDFSLGNPHLEPPAELIESLKRQTASPQPGIHRYMPNPGFPEVRQKVADSISAREGIQVPAANVVMTVGAACGLEIALRALLNPGDEVVLFAPIFAEYRFYVMHARGVCKLVETTPEFDLDLEAAKAAIGPKTRVVLVNSPNNPTGRVYPESTIRGLTDLLRQKSQEFGKPIVLLSDEPYRRLVYDGITVPPILPQYEHAISVSSFSKELGVAGERIGYLAVHPAFSEADKILAGLIFCLRTMGFVNAPAIMQLAIADSLGASVDVDAYRQNRDLFYHGLREIGYDVVKPEGAFFLFPRTPIPDDVAFVRILQKQNVLAVPGSGFSRSGHIRLSYAVQPDVIRRALPRFKTAFDEC
jgi:aspartate aminotransferase